MFVSKISSSDFCRVIVITSKNFWNLEGQGPAIFWCFSVRFSMCKLKIFRIRKHNLAAYFSRQELHIFCLFLPELQQPPWSRVVLKNLLVSKFPPFYETWSWFYCGYKIPPVVRIMYQMDLVHASPPCFCNIHFNISLPSMLRSSKWCLSFKFPPLKLWMCLPHTRHTPHPPRPWFDHPNNIWGGGADSEAPHSALLSILLLIHR